MRKFLRIAVFLILVVACAFGLNKLRGVAIFNSTIDNSPIGGTTPSTGAFTTVTASGSPGFTGSLSGNATTATSLFASPSQCSLAGAIVQGGVNSSGAPSSCGPTIRWGILAGSSCGTGSSTYSTCTSSGSWNANFPNASQVFVVCQAGGVSDPRAIIQLATGSQTGFVFQVVTEGSVAVSVSNTTCIGVQFS